MNVERWHQETEHYSQLFQKGMRVMVSDRAVMDRWKTEEGEFEALKIQTFRVSVLPHLIAMVSLSPPQTQASQQSNRPQPVSEQSSEVDEYPDPIEIH